MVGAPLSAGHPRRGSEAPTHAGPVGAGGLDRVPPSHASPAPAAEGASGNTHGGESRGSHGPPVTPLGPAHTHGRSPAAHQPRAHPAPCTPSPLHTHPLLLIPPSPASCFAMSCACMHATRCVQTLVHTHTCVHTPLPSTRLGPIICIRLSPRPAAPWVPPAAALGTRWWLLARDGAGAAVPDAGWATSCRRVPGRSREHGVCRQRGSQRARGGESRPPHGGLWVASHRRGTHGCSLSCFALGMVLGCRAPPSAHAGLSAAAGTAPRGAPTAAVPQGMVRGWAAGRQPRRGARRR